MVDWVAFYLLEMKSQHWGVLVVNPQRSLHKNQNEKWIRMSNKTASYIYRNERTIKRIELSNEVKFPVAFFSYIT